MTSTTIVNLTGTGLPEHEARKAGQWMAKAFAQAPAEPGLAIFFGSKSYEENTILHESLWASHLNRVAHSGNLLGAMTGEQWTGFRCFFPPGQGRRPYDPEFRIEDNTDWDRFLQLAGQQAYLARLRQWSEMTTATAKELALDAGPCYTTSIIVVHPEHQRRGIGRLLDQATREMVRKQGRSLFLRTHEHALPFYLGQGHRVLASPQYSIGDTKPFKVHFLMWDGGPKDEVGAPDGE